MHLSTAASISHRNVDAGGSALMIYHHLSLVHLMSLLPKMRFV